MKDKILNRLKKETEKKGFDPVMDHGSDGEIGPVYFAAGLYDDEDGIIDKIYYLEDLDDEDEARKLYEKMDKTDIYPTEGKIWEDVLEDYIIDRFNEFEAEFSIKATIAGGNKIELYRCITLENPEEFIKDLKEKKQYKEYSGAGIYWSWDKDAAECHWAGEGDTYTLTALAGMQSIDYNKTARANLSPALGSEEKEICLKDNSPVVVTKLETEDRDVLFSGKMRTTALVKALRKVIDAD